ncbi:MAG: SDR family NAD(P)-dependent oxidoreductase [Actinomycetales bacterium]
MKLEGQLGTALGTAFSDSSGMAMISPFQARVPGVYTTARPADLADPEQVCGLVEDTVSTHGRLDGVVANAGVMAVGTVAEASVADWQQAIDVNLTSTFMLAQQSIPHLRSIRGAFVAVGSIAGIRAPKGAAAYAITKSAIGMLVVIAVEEAGNGVRANCVNPG